MRLVVPFPAAWQRLHRFTLQIDPIREASWLHNTAREQVRPSVGDIQLSLLLPAAVAGSPQHSSTISAGTRPRVFSRFPPAHNMALCSLCSGLPFTGFPRFTPSRIEQLADDRELIVAHFDSGKRLPDPIGVPYHENINALAESAKTCDLCAVVQAGVQAWRCSWKEYARSDGEPGGFENLTWKSPLEERLWLTETATEKQGFGVWALNRGWAPQSLYLLALVGFCVEERTCISPISLTSSTPASFVTNDNMLLPDSPLKNQFRARPIDPDSGSLRSLDWATSSVQNCINHHQECSDESDVLLPSRVLDVEVEGGTITLVDGSSIPGNSGKYACLSYCVSSSSS